MDSPFFRSKCFYVGFSLFLNLVSLFVLVESKCASEFRLRNDSTSFLFSFADLDSGAELLVPDSIFPCLDHFELIVNRKNLPHSEYEQLIRVYSSENPKNRLFQDYRYISEFHLPQNDILKIKCSFFSPNYRYYCFSYVAFHRSNRSIKLWTQPECKATLVDDIDSTYTISSLDMDFPNQTLSSYGPSYKFSHHSQPNDHLIEPENFYDFNQPPRLTVNCDCNHIFVDLDGHVDTILIKVSSCSDQENGKCSTTWDLPTQSNQHGISLQNNLFCTVNFSVPSVLVRVQIAKKMGCDENGFTDGAYSRHSLSSSHDLVMRNGPLSISPQLQLDHKPLEHRLDSSSIMRIESPIGNYYEIHATRVLEANEAMYFHGIFTGTALVSWFIIFLISFIFLSLFLFVFMSFLCHGNQETVRIVVAEDGPHTSTSFVDVSSLGNFSFADSGSLEMDYYDYGVQPQGITISVSHHPDRGSIQCDIIMEEPEEESSEKTKNSEEKHR